MATNKIVIGVVAVVIIAGGGWYILARHADPTLPGAMTNMNMSPSPSASGAAVPTATSTVAIQNFAFSPTAITVKKGTTVTWTNHDSAGHTVTETDGLTGPASGTLQQGQSYSFTFNATGTFHYKCAVHPYMTGTVTVTD